MFSILLIIFSIILTPLGGIKTNSQDNYLKKEINNYLDKVFSNYESYDYQIIQMPKGESIKLVRKNELNLHKSLLYLPVEIKDNLNRTRNSFITLRIKLFKNVLVVKNSLERNHIFSSADVKIEKLDINQINGTPFTDINEVSDFRSKININPETVLIKEIIEPKPAVYSGDKISARVIKGKVMLSIDAYSRQDGAKGDIIKIRTKDNKQFKAKVIDSKNVLIIE